MPKHEKVLKPPVRRLRSRPSRRLAWYHDLRTPESEGKVKALVFDMGHVFVDFDWSEVCRGFCLRAGCTLDDIGPVMHELSQLGYESGHIGTDAFLAEINARLKSDISRVEFNDLWTRTFRENEQMAELLQKLRTQTTLCLLSNTNEVHYDFLQDKYDVARHFHKSVLSYKVRSSKPADTIYVHVHELTGFMPAEHFFVDDRQENIDAARRNGWQASLFRGYDPLVIELQERGFSV